MNSSSGVSMNPSAVRDEFIARIHRWLEMNSSSAGDEFIGTKSMNHPSN